MKPAAAPGSRIAAGPWRAAPRVDDIPEPAARERYLAQVPGNARVVALARAWLGDETVSATTVTAE
jgi:hypothetical protein